MQKLNTLGVELQELKNELLKTEYPDVVKKALFGHADKLVESSISIDLHVSLTDQKIKAKDFLEVLLENDKCIKTSEEMLVEFEKIRESIQVQIDEDGNEIDITSQSIIEDEQIAFTKTFKMDNLWVSEYFGQPQSEVNSLMVRNGFVEKFAVLRLSKILEDFMNGEDFKENKLTEVKATRVFYDVEGAYYGIHLMFYVNIDITEDEKKTQTVLEYVKKTSTDCVNFVDLKMKI